MTVLTPLLVSAAICGPAIEVTYWERAPYDFVILRNLSRDGWQVAELRWVLTGSAGDLVFDTAPGGPGIASSQSFRALDGAVRLRDQPLVADGSTELTLRFAAFPPAELFRFAIDLDDRRGSAGGTLVENAEIEGARVEARFVLAEGIEITLSGQFDAEATARLTTPCTA